MLLLASCKKRGGKKAERERRPRGGARSQGAWLTRCRRRPSPQGGEERRREVERQSLEGGGREGRRDGEEARTHEGQSDGGAPTAEPTLQPGARSIAGPPEHCRLETSRMFAEPRINLSLLLFEIVVSRLSTRQEKCSGHGRSRRPWRVG